MPFKETSFLRIDETPTEEENERIVSSRPDFQAHVRLVHSTFDLVPVIVKHAAYRTDSELCFLRLGIRLFNSAASALKLARSGYYQPALSMIRDVVEVQFLIDLFSRNPSELDSWVELAPSERERNFKPYMVRDKLDGADGFAEKRRGEAYKRFCQYATHPTPEGFSVISPDGLTKIGPFPSEDILGACIEELAKHFPYAALRFSGAFQSSDREVLDAKEQFLSIYKEWKSTYLPSS